MRESFVQTKPSADIQSGKRQSGCCLGGRRQWGWKWGELHSAPSTEPLRQRHWGSALESRPARAADFTRHREEWREDKDRPWTLQGVARERCGQRLPGFAQSHTLHPKGRAASRCPSPCFPHDTLPTRLTCLSPTPDAQEAEGPFL